MVDHKSGEVISLEELGSLNPIECPIRGKINFPCAICKQCDIGEVTLTFGDGYLAENTVNSVLYHISLDMRDDPVEKAALGLLKAQLSEKVPAIQKGEWDEGDLAILITDDMAKDENLVTGVAKFIQEFPQTWRMLAIEAKRSLATWAQTNAKQSLHKYFRDVRP